MSSLLSSPDTSNFTRRIMGLSTSAAMAIVLAGLLIVTTVVQESTLHALENRLDANSTRKEIMDNYRDVGLSIQRASITNNTIVIIGANNGDIFLNLSELDVELDGVIVTKNITSIMVNKSMSWVVADKVFPSQYIKITIANVTASNGSKIALIGKSGVIAFSTIVNSHPNAVAGQSVIVAEGEEVKFNGTFSGDNSKDFFEWYKPLDWKSYNDNIVNYSWTFNDPYSNHTNRNYAYGFESEHTFSKPNSNGGGISIFDDVNQRFRYSITKNDSSKLVSNFIKNITYFNGITYIGTEKGVSRYDIRLQSFMLPLQCENDTASDFITTMCGDGGDLLYVGTDKGVNIFNTSSNIYNTSALTESSGLLSDYVYSLFVKSSTLYIGTDKGVTLYNIMDKVVIGNITTENGLASNVVKTINAIGDVVFFGTDNGISRFNTSVGKSIRIEYAQNLNIYNGLASNNVKTLAVKNTALYIGTDAGVSIFNASLGTSGAFAPALTIKNGLTSNDVRSITVGDNVVYIGTNCGINRFVDTTNGLLTPVLTTTDTMNGLRYNKITTICALTSGYIIVGMEDDSGYSTPYTVTLLCKDSDENTGVDNLTVWVRNQNAPRLAKQLDTTVHGLGGEYYDDQATFSGFKNLVGLRMDSAINFDSSLAPWSLVAQGRDTFSVIWRGMVRADYKEDYTFYVTKDDTRDDQSRLWIDNIVVVDAWTQKPKAEYSGMISLAEGWHNIKYEFYRHGVDKAVHHAIAKLSWSSAHTPKQVIPTDHFVPPVENAFLVDGVNSKNEADEDTPLTFDATTAFTDNAGILKYAWDFNGDGVWDTPLSKDSVRVTHAFTEPNDVTEKYDMNNNGQLDGDIFLDVNGNGLLDSEPFIDINSNGRWDPEPFVDMNRSGKWDYTDTNENGKYDPGEPYYDVNKNGKYDAGEPWHDSDNDHIYDAPEPCEPFTDWGNGKYDPSEPFTDCRVTLDGRGELSALHRALDGTVTDGNGTYDEGEPYVDVNKNGRWDWGENFTDLNSNGKWDPGEPFVDVGNGVWGGEPFIDVSGDGYFQDRELADGRMSRITGYNIQHQHYDWEASADGGVTWGVLTDNDVANNNNWVIGGEPYEDTNGNGRFDYENFTDINGNGICDFDEPYIETNGILGYQLGEPFDDLNGDGLRLTNEFFGDSDGDGMYTIASGDLFVPAFDLNGDGMWTGEPYNDINGNRICDHELYTDTNGNGRWDGEPFMDINNNGYYDYYGEPYTDRDKDGKFDDAEHLHNYISGPVGARGYYGEPYTDVNGNGVFDLGEPYNDFFWINHTFDPGPGAGYLFTDLNGDGIWNSGDGVWNPGEPYVDANNNGKYDAGEPYTDVNGALNGEYDIGDPYKDRIIVNDKWDLGEPYVDVGSGEKYIGSDQAFTEDLLFAGASNTPHKLDGDVIHAQSTQTISRDAENFMMDSLKDQVAQNWYVKPYEDKNLDNLNENPTPADTTKDPKPYTDVNKNGRYDGIGEVIGVVFVGGVPFYDRRPPQYLAGDAFWNINGVDISSNARLNGDYFTDSNGNDRFDMYNDYLTPANDTNNNGKLDGPGYVITLYAEDEEGNFATVSSEIFIRDITKPYADFTAPQPTASQPMYEENHVNDSDWDHDGDLNEDGPGAVYVDYHENNNTVKDYNSNFVDPATLRNYIDLDRDLDNDADIYSRNFKSDGIVSFKIGTASDNVDTTDQLNYTWNFGDPYATSKNPNIKYAKFGDTVSHTYTRIGNDAAWNIVNDGTFTVSLTVRDRCGNSYTISHMINIRDAETPKIMRLSVTNTRSAVWGNFYLYVKDSFVALPQGRTFYIGDTAFFNVEATDNIGITKYQWDFEYYDDTRGDYREDLKSKATAPNATWVYYNSMSRDDGDTYTGGTPYDYVFVVRVQVYDAEGNWRAQEFTVKVDRSGGQVMPRK
ncbi:MAG: PA14 domain-containing protein [Thermoplasmata archaeon]